MKKVIALALCVALSVPCSAEVITYGGYQIDVPEVFERQEDESILQDGLHFNPFMTEDGDLLIITFYDIPKSLAPIYAERKGFFHSLFDVDEEKYTLESSEDLDLPAGIPASVRVYKADTSLATDVCFNDGVTAVDLLYTTFNLTETPGTFSDFTEMAQGVKIFGAEEVVDIISQLIN